MDWQEYEARVAALYEQTEGIGTVRKNVRIPDRITGQPRQVDALIELETKGHTLKIIIDAKFHKNPIDVKVIEEVAALASAVSANKAVIVCANGWTNPAEKWANSNGLDLRLWTVEEAVEFLDPDKWEMCPACERDCIVMDHSGSLTIDGVIFWWIAGQCLDCRTALAWCQECGEQILISPGQTAVCNCGHLWSNNRENGMALQLATTNEIVTF